MGAVESKSSSFEYLARLSNCLVSSYQGTLYYKIIKFIILVHGKLCPKLSQTHLKENLIVTSLTLSQFFHFFDELSLSLIYCLSERHKVLRMREIKINYLRKRTELD